MKPKQASERNGVAKNAPLPNGSPTTSATTSEVKRSAAASERRSTAHEHDIVTTAEGLTRLTTFVDLVRVAGLTELLRGVGPLTVFAPTDRAFTRMSEGQLDELKADSSRLAEVLRHHVVEGRVKAPKPEVPRVATPIDGEDLTLTSVPDAYRVDKARLVQTNIRASNGVIHAIDRVLMPA